MSSIVDQKTGIRPVCVYPCGQKCGNCYAYGFRCGNCTAFSNGEPEYLLLKGEMSFDEFVSSACDKYFSKFGKVPETYEEYCQLYYDFSDMPDLVSINDLKDIPDLVSSSDEDSDY